MADRQNALTAMRDERRLGRTQPMSWDASPFKTLQRISDEMDRMFEDFGFDRRWSRPLWSEGAADLWAPDVEVLQKDNELTIRADLPGLKREEVTVEVTDNDICIQGERKHDKREERENYYRSERGYGSFCRVIPLPEGAITDQAKASFKDGVLEITMPAPPASKGRRLEITEGAKK